MPFVLNDYLDELSPLINVDCGTLCLEGIETIVKQMEQKYQEMGGWTVKRVDCTVAGTGLEIRNQPENEQIDLMLIGHMDTVFPIGTAAVRPFRFDETHAYGPGVSDMKSGLLNVVYALRGLDKAVFDRLSICVCMNPDEEIGSLYSEEWLKSVAKNARCVLVAEAARSDGALVKARKGMARYKLSFHGKAAHAGNDPEKGCSAISEMAHWIIEINKLTNLESGSTFNVGLVNGGNSANIVPAYAEAIVDVRFWDNEEYKTIDKTIRARTEKTFLEGVTVTLEREAYKPAMTPNEKTEILMRLVEQTGKELDLDITWQAVGGGSDANLTSVLGVPTLDGLGPIGAGFHTENEYLELLSISPRIELLKRVITKLSENKF